MSYIETLAIKNSTVMYLYAGKDEIQMDPHYQRMGGVWTLEKKQLLIDSIINDYDLPKLYFHEFSRDQQTSTGFDYSVIDGRQRLQAIWDFVDCQFPLSRDFEYQKDPSMILSGLTYDDIAKEFPKIRVAFDSFVLPVIAVRTDDEELIEDMFSRLNEAVPLNAAEKRNAIGGDMVDAIRAVSNSELFADKVRFSNQRYQHREVAARMLLVESSLNSSGRIIDTKKVYLDALARDFKEDRSAEVDVLRGSVLRVADAMANVFMDRDELLQAQGNMIVYFLIFRFALNKGQINLISRRKLIDFREELKRNRIVAENEYADASFELLEYDRLSQQGTNDASNIRERAEVLSRYLGFVEFEFEA